MGIPEALLYFSLNMGARTTYNDSDKDNIYRNPDGLPIDFDSSKYVEPLLDGNEKRDVLSVTQVNRQC
jgi:hypothetical protein